MLSSQQTPRVQLGTCACMRLLRGRAVAGDHGAIKLPWQQVSFWMGKWGGSTPKRTVIFGVAPGAWRLTCGTGVAFVAARFPTYFDRIHVPLRPWAPLLDNGALTKDERERLDNTGVVLRYTDSEGVQRLSAT